MYMLCVSLPVITKPYCCSMDILFFDLSLSSGFCLLDFAIDIMFIHHLISVPVFDHVFLPHNLNLSVCPALLKLFKLHLCLSTAYFLTVTYPDGYSRIRKL